LDELTSLSVKLGLGGSIHGPADPVGRLLCGHAAVRPRSVGVPGDFEE
jgi:hypothetical protein